MKKINKNIFIILIFIAIIFSFLACNSESEDNSVQFSTDSENLSVSTDVESDSLHLEEVYNIVFVNYDGEILDSISVNKGDQIVYSGAEPTKIKEGYTYTFIGWTDGLNGTLSTLPNAFSDLIFTAVFSETRNSYTTTWVVNEKAVEIDVNVPYGTMPEYNGASPTKSEAGKTYTFIGWSTKADGEQAEILTSIKENTVYYAVFSVSVHKFKVTWVVNEKAVEIDVNVPYGTMPEYNGASPTKSEAGKTYTFIGWSTKADGEQAEILTSIKENTVYYAVFSVSVHKFKVTWVVNEKAVEIDVNVPYGTMPEYNGATPQKNSTEQYVYTFSGWSPSLKAVTSDVVYTATFSQSLRTYTVTWLNWNGELLEEGFFEIGCIPEYSNDLPVKNEGNEIYEFFTWSPSITPIVGDATYTANFIEKDIEYSDFGAMGDGYSDDFEAIYKAHAYANATSADVVVAQQGKTYCIINTVPSAKLLEWANGIISGMHTTSNNLQCMYGAGKNHVNESGLATDCHGNIVTPKLLIWIQNNLGEINSKTAITIPIMTDVIWEGASFIIDDTNVATRIISNNRVVAPTDIQYAKDIFTVLHNSQYKITEEFSSSQYSTSMTNSKFNYLLETQKSSKSNLYALNKQIQNVGIGPHTTKLNISLGYPAMIILHNEALTNSTTRQIAGETKSVDSQNVYIRYGAHANAGAAKKETIIIDSNGNIDASTPILFDYTRIVKVEICNMNIPNLTLKGGEFTTMASRVDAQFGINADGTINHLGTEYSGIYIRRGLNVSRSNTVLDGVKHYVANEFTLKEYDNGMQGAHYAGFFFLNNCCNVKMNNCVLTGRRYYALSGTYDFNADTVCGIYLTNCTQTNFWVVENSDGTLINVDQNAPNAVLGMVPSTKNTNIVQKYWGVCGTNYCKNMVYDGCLLSRFDAHQGLYNGKIINSTVNAISVVGAGELIVENTAVFPIWNNCCVIELRSDYGSTWKGDITLKNVSVTVKGSSVHTVNIVTFGYNNHYFGYQCYLPNVYVENFTITNPQNVKNVYLYLIDNYVEGLNKQTLGTGEKNLNVIAMPEIAVMDDIKKYNFSYCNPKISLNNGNSMENVYLPIMLSVNHVGLDGKLLDVTTQTVDFRESYTVKANDYQGYVATEQYVKGCVFENALTELTIYYSYVG